MARGPGDKGPSDRGQAPDAPTRTQSVPRPATWPDRADMVSNNRAAHQMFKQNSERLQQSADARRENQNQDASQSKTAASASDKNRDYGALKREQAQATPSQAGGERTQDKAAQDRPLSFVKDHERGARAQLKTEAAKDAPQSKGQGLTFVKDQSQGIDRGR